MLHRNPFILSCRLAKQQDVRERTGIDMQAACAAINAAGRVHVLTVHGTGDRTIPVRDGKLIAEAIKAAGSELVLIEGGDHNFTGAEHRQQLVDAVVEFFARP